MEYDISKASRNYRGSQKPTAKCIYIENVVKIYHEHVSSEILVFKKGISASPVSLSLFLPTLLMTNWSAAPTVYFETSTFTQTTRKSSYTIIMKEVCVWVCRQCSEETTSRTATKFGGKVPLYEILYLEARFWIFDYIFYAIFNVYLRFDAIFLH